VIQMKRCPYAEDSDNYMTSCKGKECALWCEDAEMCSHKAQAISLADIAKSLRSINNTGITTYVPEL